MSYYTWRGQPAGLKSATTSPYHAVKTGNGRERRSSCLFSEQLPPETRKTHKCWTHSARVRVTLQTNGSGGLRVTADCDQQAEPEVVHFHAVPCRAGRGARSREGPAARHQTGQRRRFLRTLSAGTGPQTRRTITTTTSPPRSVSRRIQTPNPLIAHVRAGRGRAPTLTRSVHTRRVAVEARFRAESRWTFYCLPARTLC